MRTFTAHGQFASMVFADLSFSVYTLTRALRRELLRLEHEPGNIRLRPAGLKVFFPDWRRTRSGSR